MTPVRFLAVGATLAIALASHLVSAPEARACGCFSPPVDPVNYAVNQQAEQIIFEVHPAGTVTAHVLIRYAGSPESFAWLLPVPNVPDLELSQTQAFGVLDSLTAPTAGVSREDLCPDPAFVCERHPFPDCPSREPDRSGARDAGAAGPPTDGEGASPVDVLAREVIGSYDTIVFAATDASATVDWLNDEGFIVNDTMTPYMQPYLDAGMAFVAAKLLPGAGVEEIRPLAVTYEGAYPMIPLVLTAVAAEPEMPVTAFIYADQAYQPMDHPMIAILDEWISESPTGRNNYPMVLSRAVDEAGGDGFVVEFAGPAPRPASNGTSGCCGDFDGCFLQDNARCECPESEWDRADCDEFAPGVAEGYELLSALADRHTTLTRLTTRLSPHEMTFDAMYEPMVGEPPVSGRLALRGQRNVMTRCEADIIDRELYDFVQEQQLCAAIYCGPGECVVAEGGVAGCLCDAGHTARRFTDLDGQPSVTCIPDAALVDLEAGGLELQSPCDGVSCGAGTCIDIGGFATCACAGGGAAALVDPTASVPTCFETFRGTGSPGAEDFSAPMEDVRACAPAPPSCGEFGWLVRNTSPEREGVLCPSSVPDAARFEIPDEPTCRDVGPGPGPGPGGPSGSTGGCAATSSGAAGPGSVLLGLLVAAALLRRRRRP